MINSPYSTCPSPQQSTLIWKNHHHPLPTQKYRRLVEAKGQPRSFGHEPVSISPGLYPPPSPFSSV